ncbi:MAG: glutamate 5-kinase [Propionibacteriaceae bacterium]|nr:glutamate 5-kinase [Propionibacteriaceae bacterium]
MSETGSGAQGAQAASEAELRQRIASAKRVVVKVGSSSLTTNHQLDTAKLYQLVTVLANAHAAGRQLVLVSSGAIAAGMGPLGWEQRPHDLASQQAAAALGQGLLIARYTEAFGVYGIKVAQVLLTVADVTSKESYENAQRTLDKLASFAVVPVVNENDTVATQEITFGDNDRLAALTAALVGAEALIVLSDVDALYTTAPAAPGAQRVSWVDDVNALAVDTSQAGTTVGTGGMTTKLQAAQIAVAAGIPVLLSAASCAADALGAVSAGTVFAPKAQPGSE